ncbi:MFS transporter [Pseudonocardia sp. K10HN5]|uniref:MFS transporter n=2 Tax=Pseudonocardia acidicola TaxID=2724939 RepID=A0ABX1S9P2_9PSEU|nr:MFS transporter [Pseudonocardia acidicola]NMH97081.1 MFS transporter [Pseudonocardia acidicola]
MFAVAWGGNEFTPLLVMYRQAGGFSAQVVDLLLGAYVLGIVPALLLGGPLSDRYGRRPLLLLAPPLGIAGSAVLAAGHDSAALLFAGRMLSGLALGLVMAVGSSWVKELSSAPYDDADPGAGARRASMALTAGFGLGAVAAAGLAQWGPWPYLTPYLLNIVVTAPAGMLLLRAPETRPSRGRVGSLLADLRVPAAAHRRFLRVVVPMAPWVFGSAASAYAILPGVLLPRTPGVGIAFSGLLCLVALGCGVAVQPLARRLDDPHSARAVGLALVIGTAGMLAAAAAAATLSPGVAVVAAAVLGSAYGLLLVSGLLEIQRIAGPDDLAGLTAVFYSVSYLGFFVPVVLAVLHTWWDYPTMFAAGTVLAVVTAVAVRSGRRITAGRTAAASRIR